MNSFKRMALMAALGAAMAACGSTLPSATDNGSNGGGGSGGGQGIVFKVTVDFSGPDPVQGTFTDQETGYASCSQYASMNTALGWIGPAPSSNGGTSGQVGGKTVSWNFGVSKNDFHGPGTYSKADFGALVIGSDDYSKTTATATINADGSGQATIANGETFNGPSGTESGTFTWTCAGS